MYIPRQKLSGVLDPSERLSARTVVYLQRGGAPTNEDVGKKDGLHARGLKMISPNTIVCMQSGYFPCNITVG